MNKSLRKQIEQKCGGKCAYCGKDLPAKGWHVDHIDPCLRGHAGIGGSDGIENLNPACRRCNLWKGGMSLEEFRREIGEQANRLIRDSAAFRLANDYRVINITREPVHFYFEVIEQLKPKQEFL